MPLSHSSVVFDVEDFKVYSLSTDAVGASPTYGAAVDVPGIAEVSFEPNFVTAELKGDATIIAKRGRIDQINFSATYGKVALDVLNVVLGGAGVTDTGTTPNQTSTMRLFGANSLPYFKTECRIRDVETGLADVRIIVYKCQLTGGTLLGGSSDEFGQPTIEAAGIKLDGNDRMFEVTFDETLTSLSA